MEKNVKIWASSGLGLGDCWASLNYVLLKSIENNRVEKMSFYYKKGDKKRYYYNKVNEILPLIESNGKVEFVDLEPTYQLSWKEVYNLKYFSSIYRWKKNNSKIICYQFDGKSHKCKNMHNKEEENEIIKNLIKNGFEIIKLGGDVSLKESLICLSKCELFIGVESGFAHLANSVGTPVFMIINGRKYKGISDVHKGREMVLCDDFVSVNNKINYYVKDCEYYNKEKVVIL